MGAGHRRGAAGGRLNLPVLVGTPAPGLTLDALPWPDDRAALRTAVRDLPDAGVVVHGPLSLLHRVVAALHRHDRASSLPVGLLPTDDTSRALAERVGACVDPGRILDAPAVPRLLVRDDRGDVVLDRAVLGADGPFGAQAYHDDAKVADGRITRLTAVPDYTSGRVEVTVRGRLRSRRTVGRAVQIACDEAVPVVDGIVGDPVVKRTWYADDRAHWLLRVASGVGR